MEKIFHPGEQAIHTLLGVSEEAHQLEGMIKDRIAPAAMRMLPAFGFVLATSIDSAGNVWTSFLTGSDGFLSVVSDKVISLSTTSDKKFLNNVQDNNEVGLLFINFEARVRLRINGTVVVENDRLVLTVKQSYFNCPKYIQARKFELAHQNHTGRESGETGLNDSHSRIIQAADTFFISTYVVGQGADCSHRGGSPGFVEVVDHQTIQWLDYPGNNLYNTIGNLHANPNCGLLFMDFTNNRMLQLTGTARFVVKDEESRFVVFTLKWINDIAEATPFKWEFLGYSQFNLAC
jgi:predicted pyridoxine 5'-phosphate oxidase superfamily flavin-nucleotide-binding protein